MTNQVESPQRNARLTTAVANAQLVLEFVCRRRDEVPDAQTIETVTGAGELLTSSGWSAEKEAAFWLAYNKLAVLARPATVDTLLSSWSARGHRGRDCSGKGDAKSPPPEARANPRGSFAHRAVSWLGGRWDYVTRPRRVHIGHAAQRYRQWALVWLVAIVVLQVYWGLGTSVVNDLAKDIAAVQAGAADNAAHEVHMTANLALLRITTFGLAETGLAESASKATRLRYYLEVQTFLNGAVLGYILPILLGTLGASVYIMRRVAEEVAEFTFSGAREVQYRLRVYLGGIAGLMVGWFLNPGGPGDVGDVLAGTSMVASISPLALSFLAGYSVELLFAAMDQLVDAYTGQAPAKQSETKATGGKATPAAATAKDGG